MQKVTARQLARMNYFLAGEPGSRMVAGGILQFLKAAADIDTLPYSMHVHLKRKMAAHLWRLYIPLLGGYYTIGDFLTALPDPTDALNAMRAARFPSTTYLHTVCVIPDIPVRALSEILNVSQSPKADKRIYLTREPVPRSAPPYWVVVVNTARPIKKLVSVRPLEHYESLFLYAQTDLFAANFFYALLDGNNATHLYFGLNKGLLYQTNKRSFSTSPCRFLYALDNKRDVS